jgi:hypothetical protein
MNNELHRSGRIGWLREGNRRFASDRRSHGPLTGQERRDALTAASRAGSHGSRVSLGPCRRTLVL